MENLKGQCAQMQACPGMCCAALGLRVALTPAAAAAHDLWCCAGAVCRRCAAACVWRPTHRLHPPRSTHLRARGEPGHRFQSLDADPA